VPGAHAAARQRWLRLRADGVQESGRAGGDCGELRWQVVAERGAARSLGWAGFAGCDFLVHLIEEDAKRLGLQRLLRIFSDLLRKHRRPQKKEAWMERLRHLDGAALDRSARDHSMAFTR
jgi:hypothetical protein